MTGLAGWQNFYVITGSSAGALIGLQFVVLSLISNATSSTGMADAGRTFSTPTIVHFGAVLGLSGILCAPWDGIGAAALLWGVVGVCGVVYVGVVTRRMRSQKIYRPQFEDWLFHSVLPIAGYLTLAVSAGVVGWRPREVLFGVGAAALLLLFIGIHNAWDAVTYHLFVKRAQE